MASTRREFPRPVRVAVIKRATRDSVVYCESCKLPCRRFQLDHVIADSHGGKPVIENAELICETCFAVKNPIDTTIAAKLKRQEADRIGANSAPQRPLESRDNLPKGRNPRHERMPLTPKQLYEAI